MKYRTITVITNHADADLVASVMFDLGANGVSILDKQDFLELVKSDVIWDYVDESVLLQGDDVKVSTIFAFDEADITGELQEVLDEMKAEGSLDFSEILVGEVDAADWENEWKKYYKPIVTKHITIVPTWIKYDPSCGERIMKLDPGMAFGTGEHATTRMCLEMMEARGKDVLDVGCGSGILGIAAAICGAKSVYMCDIDNNSVGFSKINAAANNVDCTVEQADLLKGKRKGDFIFANITADVLMRLAKDIGKHLNKGGTIVLSGIIDSRLQEVEECYLSNGFKIIDRMSTDDWRALKLVRA